MRWLLAGIVAWVSLASAAPPRDLVKVELRADVVSIQPGTPFRVALKFTIEPGWHIYWVNPGEGGLPTKATLQLPAGWSATPFEFPVPKTFDLPGGLTAYGYENEAVLLATVTPGNDVGISSEMTAKANWLVCKDICVAGNATPKLTLPRDVQGERDPEDEHFFQTAVALMPAQAGQSPDVGEISDDFEMGADGKSGTLAVVIQWKRELPDQIEFFPPPVDGINFAKPQVNSQPTRTTITTSFDLLAGQKPPAGAVDSVLSWRLGDRVAGVKVPIHFESHVQTVK